MSNLVCCHGPWNPQPGHRWPPPWNNKSSSWRDPIASCEDPAALLEFQRAKSATVQFWTMLEINTFSETHVQCGPTETISNVNAAAVSSHPSVFQVWAVRVTYNWKLISVPSVIIRNYWLHMLSTGFLLELSKNRKSTPLENRGQRPQHLRRFLQVPVRGSQGKSKFPVHNVI